MRPRCACNRCEIGKPWTVGQCRRCWLYHNNLKYRAYWDGAPVASKLSRPLPHGPGVELKQLLGELGVVTTGGCGCEDRARQMDQWGVAGCREQRSEIVAWLHEQQQKLGWTEKLVVGVRMIAAGASITDPVGWLVDEAIRRAEIDCPAP